MEALNLLLVSTVVVVFKSTLAKYSEGILDTQSKWEFLDRFCFVSQQGTLRYEFLFPTTFMPQFLFLYYDSATQWPAVYKTGKTCEEKRSVLSVMNNQIISLADRRFSSGGCSRFLKDKQHWYNCTDERRFLSYRERWWYLAIANCNSSQGLYMQYKLWMSNGERENFWFFQFSADEFYILPTDIVFLLLELFALVVAVTVALLLRARQMFHQTYKLFLVSLVLEVLSLFCDCVAYGDYAENGVGIPVMKVMGEMCRAASKLTFLLLLILMAKGYTITRGRLSMFGTWKIALFMTIYSLIYTTLFIWQAKVFDPGEVLYLYDSPAGYGIIVMRLVGWIWFCYAIYFTLVHYPEKRGFYFRFAVSFSIWFWMGPVVIVLSNLVLSSWHREKVVNGVENAICFLGFAAFLFITRPSTANTNFPYHVRTTQIDVLNESDDSERSTSLPHHTYELGRLPKDDVFTVSGRNRIASEKFSVNFQKSDPFIRSRVDEGPDLTDPLNRACTVPDSEPPPSYEETVNYVVRSPGSTTNSGTLAI